MTSTNAYEGVTDAQRELISYWTSLRSESGRVRRSDIDPGRLRAQLRSIVILDVSSQIDPVVRLAGSNVYEFVGRELRGEAVSNLPQELAVAMTRGVNTACAYGAPVGGVLDVGMRRHAWLRLPLWIDDRVAQVLCHDELVRDDKDGPVPDPLLDDMVEYAA